ncbi:MAG TPA: hypothetical protein VE172_03960 [Stackebrandtia sp.]|jgi:hypothetical protein|uniref:hypothetical protein n=1 Tax=Stackebrandtia sp. TaxID=2023065 RepID=UPI002D72AF7F|nr:hypothetical protein [Stackebrandtia sp.]HZE37945.1 hypothetical protein [Stackebrandtia sp.]
MRDKGITYDTGFRPGGVSSRPRFDADTAARELRVIAEDLHCDAVRITGDDPHRLAIAARLAADVGLRVWFSPFPTELTAEEMLPFLATCARSAEELRRDGADVVFVAGCEVSMFAAGFLPGDTVHERIANLATADLAALADVPARVNDFLTRAAADTRAVFGGPISYAAGPWEDLDWSPFDIVTVDAYRDVRNAANFRELLAGVFRHGKPVAIGETGCATYRGAADRGGMGWAILDRTVSPPMLDGDYVRDEDEQVRYLRDLLPIAEAAGVESFFWFTFANYHMPHRPTPPRADLDLGSFGVVRVLDGARGTAYPDMTWEPKKSFHALAEAYAARA